MSVTQPTRHIQPSLIWNTLPQVGCTLLGIQNSLSVFYKCITVFLQTTVLCKSMQLQRKKWQPKWAFRVFSPLHTNQLWSCRNLGASEPDPLSPSSHLWWLWWEVRVQVWFAPQRVSSGAACVVSPSTCRPQCNHSALSSPCRLPGLTPAPVIEETKPGGTSLTPLQVDRVVIETFWKNTVGSTAEQGRGLILESRLRLLPGSEGLF